MTVQTSVTKIGRKTERDGAEVTESGRMFQKRLPITGKCVFVMYVSEVAEVFELDILSLGSRGSSS